MLVLLLFLVPMALLCEYIGLLGRDPSQAADGVSVLWIGLSVVARAEKQRVLRLALLAQDDILFFIKN
jgi:hypothetical protein